MNHEIDDIPRFNDPILEREWLAQENAVRRERLHLGSSGDNARSQHYRLLARVLLTAPARRPARRFRATGERPGGSASA